ncbi:MAG: PleD family two-component system response regulator [Rickettsiales bacterium]
MTARVLVVDDIDFNVKLLDTKLKQEYYNVFTAFNGKEAIQKAKEVQPDIILMDIMMPEMDGFEATRIIKSQEETMHIPIIMVTALHAQEDRVRGLEAGADDFLTKPINDQALMIRLKSLVRLKLMIDELRLRDQTSQHFGVTPETMEKRNKIEGSNVLVIEDDVVQAKKIKDKLMAKGLNVDVCETAEVANDFIAAKKYALLIISTLLFSADGLRLCSEFRSKDELRHTPILIMIDEHDERTLTKGLEIGVNDYLLTPIDANELMARVTTQIRRKNYQDQLKDNYLSSIAQSITDGLTGLHNRRYFDTHFNNMVNQAKTMNKKLSVIMVDVDHFKKVNDTYGHQSGDEVLKEVSRRVQLGVRTADLCARYGGEEFVIVLPDTDAAGAKVVGERLRSYVEGMPFPVPVEPKTIKCTASFGVSELKADDTCESLLGRADQGLYKAKEGGRNQVAFIA